MTYLQGENAINTLIQSVTGFGSPNVAQSDWRPLKGGGANIYAILRPGTWENRQLTVSTFERQWRTVVEVWQRYIDEASVTNLKTRYISILEKLEKNPDLGSPLVVMDSLVSGGGDMQERVLNNDSLWAVWELYIDWKEHEDVTYE